MFQRYSVCPRLSVLENVALGLEFRDSPWLGRLFGMRRKRALEQAETLLQAVGLTHVRDALPAALSGGMQQRVAIAQALILGALDPGIRNIDPHEPSAYGATITYDLAGYNRLVPKEEAACAIGPDGQAPAAS